MRHCHVKCSNSDLDFGVAFWDGHPPSNVHATRRMMADVLNSSARSLVRYAARFPSVVQGRPLGLDGCLRASNVFTKRARTRPAVSKY